MANCVSGSDYARSFDFFRATRRPADSLGSPVKQWVEKVWNEAREHLVHSVEDWQCRREKSTYDLFFAIQNEDYKAAHKAIKNGADLNSDGQLKYYKFPRKYPFEPYGSPLDMAIRKNSAALIKLLVRAGAKINHYSIIGRHESALHTAISDEGRGPIMPYAKSDTYSAQEDNHSVELVNLLLNCGAKHTRSPNCPRSATPFHYAIAANKPKTVQLLLQKFGHSLLYDHAYGQSPLHIAAKVGNPELLDVLLRAYAENKTKFVNAPSTLQGINTERGVGFITTSHDCVLCISDDEGRNPLHYLSNFLPSERRQAMTKRLIDAGALDNASA